jgi:hypothetical protein
VDASRLGDLVGHVRPEEMWGIDEALLSAEHVNLDSLHYDV